MKNHYDNSERLEGVSEQEWREALDELTAYLTWRLRGKTRRGAHSEKVLGMSALDYYQEEAVVKLIEGVWKWQERLTLGKQLIQIATNLITKQRERYQRAHPWEEDPESDDSSEELRVKSEEFCRKAPQFVEVMDPERIPDMIDDDGQEELDETYELVMSVVKDDVELVEYVEAIRECNSFKDLPEKMGISIKRVYRLQEKLMRRVKKIKVKN